MDKETRYHERQDLLGAVGCLRTARVMFRSARLADHLLGAQALGEACGILRGGPRPRGAAARLIWRESGRLTSTFLERYNAANARLDTTPPLVMEDKRP